MRLIAAAVAAAAAAAAVGAHKATHLLHLLRFSVNWLELHTHTLAHTQPLALSHSIRTHSQGIMGFRLLCYEPTLQQTTPRENRSLFQQSLR